MWHLMFVLILAKRRAYHVCDVVASCMTPARSCELSLSEYVCMSDCPAESLLERLIHLPATSMVLLLHACSHTAHLLFVHHYPASPPWLLGDGACHITQHVVSHSTFTLLALSNRRP